MIYRLEHVSKKKIVPDILDSSWERYIRGVRWLFIPLVFGYWSFVYRFSCFWHHIYILDAMNGLRITSTYFVCKIGSVSCIKKRMFIPLNNLYFDHFSVRSNPLCFTCRFLQKKSLWNIIGTKDLLVRYLRVDRSFK